MNSSKKYIKNTGFGQIIDDPVERCPDRDAIVFYDWRISYREFGRLVNQTARFLQSKGLKKGNSISVISRNCPEVLIIQFAALKLGIIDVKINWRLTPEEMEYMIDLSDVNLVFYRPQKPEWGQELVAHYEGSGKYFYNLEAERSILYDLVGGFSDEKVETEILPSDSAVHMHTSGTTGRPKCVVYTHGSLLGEVEALQDCYGYADGERQQFIAQLFHTAATGAYMSLSRGESLILMDRFDAKTYMESLEKERVTAISVVPTVLKWILDELDAKPYDVKNLHTVRYSTCPIPPVLLQRALEKFNCKFYQSYGMTEMGSIVTILGPEDHLIDGGAHMTSIGKPIPGGAFKILKEDGSECAVNEIGEICLKGPGRMKEYYKQPELTEAAFTDGWYHSKDLGFCDESGYLSICGRADDMIISGGENIYPSKIANAIMTLNEDVSEAAVYGVPDETWGEHVKASVVLMPGSKITAEEIRAYCKTKLANFEVPKEVEFLPELPKNASRKVLIKVLRENSIKH